MYKYFSYLFFGIFFIASCAVQKPSAKSSSKDRMEQLYHQMFDPQAGKVMVVAHRGDWHAYPENSIPGLHSVIEMGVHMVEIDLKRTKDGVLIVMHDNTLDRTTNQKGKVEDYTWEEIQKMKLRNGLGRVTTVGIPSFKEYLLEAKGKILINIDKGYSYFPEVVKLLRETGTLRQTTINVNTNTTLQEVEARYGKIPGDIILTPLLGYSDKDKARRVVKSYLGRKNTVFQPVWRDDAFIAEEDFVSLRKQGLGIWMNSLWASINGGHDDDRAIIDKQPDESWGWLINKGANIIQTDRPAQLLDYLKKKNLL